MNRFILGITAIVIIRSSTWLASLRPNLLSLCIKTISFCLLISFPYTTKTFCAPASKYELGLRTDNDSYLLHGQDRYYSNGIFLNFRYLLPGKAKSVHSAKILKRIAEVKIGHEIYTPYSGYAPYPEMIDRPFAAYLFMNMKGHFFLKNEQVISVGMELGILGSAAKGKELQTAVHSMLGLYKPAGWETQIRNAPGINFDISYLKTIYCSHNNLFDAHLITSAHLGTIYIDGSAGIILRAGRFRKMGASALTGSLLGTGEKIREFYAFLNPSVNVIGYNATIQGGMFNKDKGPIVFSPVPITFSSQIGAAYVNHHITIDVSVIIKTKEVKTITTNQYGSISIKYRFK